MLAGSFLFAVISVQASGDPFRISVDSSRIETDGQVSVEVIPNAPDTAVQTIRNIALTIEHDGRNIFTSESLDPEKARISFLPTEPGIYKFKVIGTLSSGSLLKQSESITVRSVKGSGEIARDVLILIVSCGVVLALTIGFFIIIRFKTKPKTVS